MKKFMGVNSRDLRNHAMGLPLPIHLPRKVLSRNFQMTKPQSGGTKLSGI
jgi:hypothetical protein